MPVRKHDTFRDFILDQIADVEHVVQRPVPGGCGLFHNAHFFGFIVHGRLYFKTNAATRASYQARGMRPFPRNCGRKLNGYYQVPDDVIEASDELCAWAKASIACCADERVMVNGRESKTNEREIG